MNSPKQIRVVRILSVLSAAILAATSIAGDMASQKYVDLNIASAKLEMQAFTTNAIAKCPASLSMGVQSVTSNNVVYTTAGSGNGMVMLAVEEKTVNALIASNVTAAAAALGVTNRMLMVWNGSDRYFNNAGQTITCTPSNFVWRGHASVVTNGYDSFENYFCVFGTKIQPTLAAAITNGTARVAMPLRLSARGASEPYLPKGWSIGDASSAGRFYWVDEDTGSEETAIVQIDEYGKITGITDDIIKKMNQESKSALLAMEDALQAKAMVRELSRNCVTDLKWDDTKKALTWNKSESSGGKEDSATFDYKLKTDGNSAWLQIGNSQAGDTVKLPKGDEQTIEYSNSADKKLGVKIYASGGLQSGNDGISIKTYSGLETSTEGLFIKKSSDSALSLGTDGISVFLSQDSGLEKRAPLYGLAIKPNVIGGITVDGNGVSVKVDGKTVVTNAPGHVGEIALKGFWDAAAQDGYVPVKQGGEIAWTKMGTNVFSASAFTVESGRSEVSLKNMKTTEATVFTRAVPYNAAGNLAWAETTGGNMYFGTQNDGTDLGFHDLPKPLSVDDKSLGFSDSAKTNIQIKGWKDTPPELGYTLAEVIEGKTQHGAKAYHALVKDASGNVAYVKIGEMSGTNETASVVKVDGETVVTNAVGYEGSMSLKGYVSAKSAAAADKPKIPATTGSDDGISWIGFNDGVFTTTAGGDITIKGLEGSDSRVMVVTGNDTPDISTRNFDGTSLEVTSVANSKIGIKGWGTDANQTATLAEMLVAGSGGNAGILARAQVGGNAQYISVGQIVIPSHPEADNLSVGYAAGTGSGVSNLCVKGARDDGNVGKVLFAGGGSGENTWAEPLSGSFDFDDGSQSGEATLQICGMEYGFSEDDVTVAGALTNATEHATFADSYKFMVRYDGDEGAEVRYVDIGGVIESGAATSNSLDNASVVRNANNENKMEINGFSSASDGHVPYKEDGIVKWKDVSMGSQVDGITITTNTSGKASICGFGTAGDGQIPYKDGSTLKWKTEDVGAIADGLSITTNSATGALANGQYSIVGYANASAYEFPFKGGDDDYIEWGGFDGASIALDETDGVVRLNGFDDATSGNVPVVVGEGASKTLGWTNLVATAFTNLTVITDIEFAIEGGMIKAKMTRAKISVASVEAIQSPWETKVASVFKKDVVVDTAYNDDGDYTAKQKKVETYLITDTGMSQTETTTTVFSTTEIQQ